MVTYQHLKKELLHALDLHIDILKDVEEISSEQLPGFLFMMRSFGFMLDRAPHVLEAEDEEEMHYMMFQYYSLLTELKYNLTLNFPYTKIQGAPLLELVNRFPTTFEQEMKQWWEEKTGLVVERRKQTIEIKEL
ncbi:hypothetical protein NRIC_17930 [Enterococcus florum]|uniref:Uncharacterized protein n=1 Tax=Enterococcus florum TaxID=2480627 RepID=A0A4P5PE67_9ENTE|nr:hypothetical protein [Enterococcus florum]GCF93902.1 hypothetical protein NRIC_17930 [Enterococcus florum]